MERRLGLRDLDLGRGEAAALGPLLEPAGEEGLAAAVLAAHRLERRATTLDPIELLVQGRLEPLEPDGERVEASLGHGAAAEGIDDLLATLRAQRRRGTGHPVNSNCFSSRGRLSSTVSDASSTDSTG